MKALCLVEETEGRELDSFDLITVLGLLKEHAFKEIWRRYGPSGEPAGTLNFTLNLENYYTEMTVESLTALALSPKYQASPHLMQALIRRLLCGHRHGLILEKLLAYGVPVGDGSQINLSCSVGTMGVDLLVNRHPEAPEYQFRKGGAGGAAASGPLRPGVHTLPGAAEFDGADYQSLRTSGTLE
jgi:hypothetical protein